MRTITIRIAGTCCFVDRDLSSRGFIKRLALPFDTLSLDPGSDPKQKHIPYVEFPEAHISSIVPQTGLGNPYPHVHRIPIGDPADKHCELQDLKLKYRRFELLGHVVHVENVDANSQDLTVLTSFDLHVPKMKQVQADLDQHPRDECFANLPDATLISGFFDISKGLLKAGTLYEFMSKFSPENGATTITAKLQTPEFVELLLPITTPEVTVTITDATTTTTIVLDDTADTITIGNQPEADIVGEGSGDDRRHHFRLYYNLAKVYPTNPSLPDVTGDPVASCTGSNWP